ncbi:MAG: hypothetical protein FJZ01_19420 [Candidatus Sericytochromatia bacterium]|nr:hypothetical protein [Candidatus Tanganyikabacteria bacterium]
MLLAGTCLLALGAPAAAQDVPDTLPGLENAPPFVADVVITNAQVKGVQYRMYYIPGYMRLESTGPTPDGSKQVILSHLRENVSFVDLGGQWYKVSNNALGAQGLQYGSTSGFRTQRLGKRTVDGKLCEGYKFTSPDGATRVEQWLWGQYPILATVQNQMGTTTAKYLSLRPQSTPASYFAPPAGQPVQDLGALTGGGGLPAGGLPGGGLPQGMSQQDLQKLLGN